MSAFGTSARALRLLVLLALVHLTAVRTDQLSADEAQPAAAAGKGWGKAERLKGILPRAVGGSGRGDGKGRRRTAPRHQKGSLRLQPRQTGSYRTWGQASFAEKKICVY